MAVPAIPVEIAAISGTQRWLPLGTPGPDCQAGREKPWLRPPPEPVRPGVQAPSVTTFQFESKVMVVPPTAVTSGSLAGYSTIRGVVAL